MQFNFEWDSQKAQSNQIKRGVGFEIATTVFRDPYAISIFDEEHSKDEERWLILGISSIGILLVVHHTFREEGSDTVIVRIISSRKATKKEELQYAE